MPDAPEPGERKAGSLVRRPPVYIRPDASIRTVAEVLDEEGIGAVLVRESGTTLAGIVTERDVVRCLAEGGDPDEERARDVMTQELETVAADATLGEITAAMVTDEIRHLPIERDGDPVGVVSNRELSRVLAELLDL